MFRLLLHHGAGIAAIGTLAGLGALLMLSSCGGPGGGRTEVSFSRQIQPIFDRSCVACHPASYPYLDLRHGRSYAQLVGAPAATAPSYERVLPGKPSLSYLLIGPEDPSRRDLLTARERKLIAAWIREGAPRN
jgi:hypothetical protein